MCLCSSKGSLAYLSRLTGLSLTCKSAFASSTATLYSHSKPCNVKPLPVASRKEKPSNVQNPAANQQDIKSWILLNGEILSAQQYRVRFCMGH